MAQSKFKKAGKGGVTKPSKGKRTGKKSSPVTKTTTLPPRKGKPGGDV